jgi:hypothetical protein
VGVCGCKHPCTHTKRLFLCGSTPRNTIRFNRRAHCQCPTDIHQPAVCLGSLAHAEPQLSLSAQGKTRACRDSRRWWSSRGVVGFNTLQPHLHSTDSAAGSVGCCTVDTILVLPCVLAVFPSLNTNNSMMSLRAMSVPRPTKISPHQHVHTISWWAHWLGRWWALWLDHWWAHWLDHWWAHWLGRWWAHWLDRRWARWLSPILKTKARAGRWQGPQQSSILKRRQGRERGSWEAATNSRCQECVCRRRPAALQQPTPSKRGNAVNGLRRDLVHLPPHRSFQLTPSNVESVYFLVRPRGPSTSVTTPPTCIMIPWYSIPLNMYWYQNSYSYQNHQPSSAINKSERQIYKTNSFDRKNNKILSQYSLPAAARTDAASVETYELVRGEIHYTAASGLPPRFAVFQASFLNLNTLDLGGRALFNMLVVN